MRLRSGSGCVGEDEAWSDEGAIGLVCIKRDWGGQKSMRFIVHLLHGLSMRRMVFIRTAGHARSAHVIHSRITRLEW